MKRLRALVDALPPNLRRALLRGDIGYGNDATMCEAESRGIPCLFKIKRSRNIQKLFRTLSGGKGWKDCGSGWEALEQRVKLDGWQRKLTLSTFETKHLVWLPITADAPSNHRPHPIPVHQPQHRKRDQHPAHDIKLTLAKYLLDL